MTPEALEAALARFRGVRVAIVGDLMLDEYVWGDVSRISPDAPVQVVEVRRRSHAAGGAANVALNIAAAGGEPWLFGVVGEDAAGETLAHALAAAGVNTSGLVVEPGRPTTTKTRVIARSQHLVRLDHEVRGPLGAAARARILAALAGAVPSCAAILVSDYAKGVVDERLVGQLADLSRRRDGGAPLLVDPKSADFTRYRGCTAITPNQRESEVASRMTIVTEEDLAEAARRIRQSSGAEWILITRGEKGMALAGPDGALDQIGTRAREVYDVTGAGDTVAAYFGLGLASGLPARQAAALANIAAGIGVGKVGTTVVDAAEVLASELGERVGPPKIVDRREVSVRVEHARSLGRRIVLTNGCFDLLHAGHVHLLERARALGDFLVVAVNTDSSVRRLKGEGRPLVGEADRLKVLSALDAVDLVVLFSEDTPIAIVELVRPDVLVKGGDYTTETIVGHELVLGYGGRVETVALLGGRSTSSLISDIRKTTRES